MLLRSFSIKRLAILSMFLCSASFIGTTQTTKPDPTLNLHFEYETQCGNPLAESMLWESVEGKVTNILNGNSIEIRLADHKHKHVTLAAVDPSQDTKGARTSLTKLVLGRMVDVLVNPDHSQRKNLVGVVHSQTAEVNRVLIETGAVAYREPAFYSMSRHAACVYRVLEQKAQDAKLGIWQNRSR